MFNSKITELGKLGTEKKPLLLKDHRRKQNETERTLCSHWGKGDVMEVNSLDKCVLKEKTSHNIFMKIHIL